MIRLHPPLFAPPAAHTAQQCQGMLAANEIPHTPGYLYAECVKGHPPFTTTVGIGLGQQGMPTHDYKRNGTTTLFAALVVTLH